MSKKVPGAVPAGELQDDDLDQVAGGRLVAGGKAGPTISGALKHNFSALSALGAKGQSSSTHGAAQKKEPNLCDCDAD